MPYLVAAVVLLGLVCLVNLVITLALIRRLRDADAGRSGSLPPLPRVMVEVGERPADFTADTVDGARLDRDAVAGRLVGFFTPHCQPCHDQVPEFVAYARNTGADAVAVLLGEPDEVDELARTLSSVARIVVQEPGGPLYTAFAVSALPAMCLLDDAGTVVASGAAFVSFPVLEPAT